jgi:23S rRNA (cytosine1962-C5)-methyltransferase
VFSGAIDKTKGDVLPGATVDIMAADGRFLGRAAASPSSQIRARVWTFDPDQAIDAAFFESRLRAAIAQRAPLFDELHTAARLVHAESDGLPGLIVDRYGDVLAVQILSAGVEAWRDVIFAALAEITGIPAIFERSDAEVRALESLPPRVGPVRPGDASEVTILENGLRYRVDIASGQKTGFFLDQRDSRRRIGALAAGRDVLDCFSYTGGFALNALRSGASSVTAIDSSGEAILAASRNAGTNGIDVERASFVEADAFKHLRLMRDQGRAFDLIVLDPPKLAPTVRHVEGAARAYKGHQSARAKAAPSRGDAGDLFMFGGSGDRTLPEDSRRRRGRRARRRADRRSAWSIGGPPGTAVLSRRQLSKGLAVAARCVKTQGNGERLQGTFCRKRCQDVHGTPVDEQ